MTLAIPLVVPAGMWVLFPVLARRLGGRRGYLAGFAIYWAGCYLVPLALLGRRQVWALLRVPSGPLPRPRWLGALALLLPPLGAAGTVLLPALRRADPALVATAGAVAAVNAAGEELLWRGLFVATFPEDPVRGWFWPSASPSGIWRRLRCGPPGTGGCSWPGRPSSAPGSDGSHGAHARYAGPFRHMSPPMPAGCRRPGSG